MCLICNREAWLHGKPKPDSVGNVPSLEVCKCYSIPTFISQGWPFVNQSVISIHEHLAAFGMHERELRGKGNTFDLFHLAMHIIGS